jgi:hypothetical protein
MLSVLRKAADAAKETLEKATYRNPLKTQEGGTHYKGMSIQPAEFIHANNIPYLEANVIKYVCRHREKGGIDDLRKAQHYIELLIHFEYRHMLPDGK